MRHPLIVQVGHHYGVTIATCVPADPESKGGSKRTVQIAKADLVPTDTNLRDDYASWAELVDACEAFMDKVNGRAHRVTRRAPVEMLAEERARLHRLPDAAFTAAFGETRKVSWTSTISFGGVTYSVPHTARRRRRCGCASTATRSSPPTSRRRARSRSPATSARHRGTRRIDDAHYPPRPAGALARQPKPTNAAEAEFLALGDGARMWLVEAAAAGHVAGEGEDGRSRSAGPPARRRAGRLGARSRRHLRPLRRRRRRLDPRRASRRATTTRRRGPLDATLHPRLGQASETSRHDRHDRTDRRGRRAVATVASAAHAPPRTRRVGHRQGATLGPGRSRPRPARPRNSPAGRRRRSTSAAPPPGSRPARPSTPGTRPCPRSPPRRNGR